MELTIKNAEECVTIMTTTEGLLRKIEGLKPVFEQLKKRGVKVRIAAPLNKEAIPAIKDLGSVAELRHTDARARFILVDRKEILFMVVEKTAIYVRDII